MEKHIMTATSHATAEAAADFPALLRAYEAAHASGADTTATLYALAAACALSVLKKCIDPQRKTAKTLEEKATDWKKAVSNSGNSTALISAKRGIIQDIEYLEKLTAAMNAAYSLEYTKDGDIKNVVVDKAAEKAAAKLQGETLTDGMDFVNAAAAAILEQTAAHADGGAGWLEKHYNMRRLCTRVIIKAEDSAKWETIETTPIQEVYRAVRREVQNSRAARTDPRNGYSYIEDVAIDPDSNATEYVYRRLGKWADIGGYSQNGQYTTDLQSYIDYNAVIEYLNLTDRQAKIVSLRMRGYGYKAIATYLGVNPKGIKTELKRLGAKCEKFGFTPAMWAEMTETE